jgi:hypothetical protein
MGVRNFRAPHVVDVKYPRTLMSGLPMMILYLEYARMTEKVMGMVRENRPSPMVNRSVILPRGVATFPVSPTSIVWSSSRRSLASRLSRKNNVYTLFRRHFLHLRGWRQSCDPLFLHIYLEGRPSLRQCPREGTLL